MDNQFEQDEEEQLRRARRKQRIAEMKKQKERREKLNKYIKKYGMYVAGLLTVILIVTGISLSRKSAEAKENEVAVTESSDDAAVVNTETSEPIMEESGAVAEENMLASEENEYSTEDSYMETSDSGSAESIETAEEPEMFQVDDVIFHEGYTAETTSDTVTPSEDDVLSSYAILMDVSTGTIIAQKDAKTIMNPASMTKVLTVLVAAEHVTNLDDTVTITLEYTDYAYVNDCSSVGFQDGEVVTVRDLFYGTILPSGGDAAIALATYVAGSHEAFVEMMNEKLEELGLSETAHFTNCVGLYDKEHYCTAYDMAMIMKAAAQNDLCREVMSTRIYTTSATEQHPDGITISNWFIRRIEDKDCGGKVICAKTGFVDQSGFCAASYAVSDDGVPYICVTAQTYSNWRCINDHVALYSEYAK